MHLKSAQEASHALSGTWRKKITPVVVEELHVAGENKRTQRSKTCVRLKAWL